jgi:FAD/FMN-containing dehydrogenase
MKKIAVCFACILIFLIAAPSGFLAYVMLQESSYEPIKENEGGMYDASRLQFAEQMSVISLSSNREETIGLIRNALQESYISDRRISIGGARHSMGGQSLLEHGIHIDMDGFSSMEMETEYVLKVQSGARWKDVVRFLHERDLSVSVMQTNHDFSVGGSISVNAHGWQHGMGPISSTVRAFDIMLADGSIAHCSRIENQELFGLALGGYGLFGVILDVWLDVVPNQRLKSVHKKVRLDDFVGAWFSLAEQERTQMLYGRLRIVPSRLFEDVLITGYIPTHIDKPFSKLEEVEMDDLKRAVFRGSEGSDFGKWLRWSLESIVGGEASGIHLRTFLQNEPVSVYANRNPKKTDVLHEYFVPRDQLVDFVRASATVIQSCRIDLLNVTIRSVDEDLDTVLRYANENVFALVMLFTYDLNTDTDETMRMCTTRLVDEVLRHRGTFYLPYRTHPTKDQFQQAYPQYEVFLKGKRKYDPQELFQSDFYEYYFHEAVE